MRLSKELSDKMINHHLPDDIAELRFELFDWLKEKGLTVQQAINLLNMTKGEIVEARCKEMDNMML